MSSDRQKELDSEKFDGSTIEQNYNKILNTSHQIGNINKPGNNIFNIDTVSQNSARKVRLRSNTLFAYREVFSN
jgi:hypothetical protein